MKLEDILCSLFYLFHRQLIRAIHRQEHSVGQFESAGEATRTIGILSLFSLAAIFLLLYMEFRSFRQTLLVMVDRRNAG